MKKPFSLFLLALLFCTPANAQPTENKYELVEAFRSEEGVQPSAIFTDGFESGDVLRYDIDGDGQQDLSLIREDENGNLQSIRVINTQTHEVIWEVQDVQQTFYAFTDITMSVGLGFYGFADPFDSGQPHAIFIGGSDIRLYDPTDNSLGWALSVFIPARFPVLLAITDFTGDDIDDLVVFLPETRQILVLTKP